MRFAILDAARVVNVALSDQPLAENWIASDDAQIGDTWDGVHFIAPALVVSVPERVTRRQARQALLLAGLLSNVQPAINAIPDATQRGLMQIEWDDSQEFERHRPSLVALATALGLDAAAVDQLFIRAGGL